MADVPDSLSTIVNDDLTCSDHYILPKACIVPCKMPDERFCTMAGYPI